MAAGEWRINQHVYVDHPERGTKAAEVKAALLNARTITHQAENDTYRVTGPSFAPPQKVVCIVRIERLAVVITAWRIPR